MKKIFYLSLVLLLVLPFLSACGLQTKEQTETGKVTVATTIFPLYDLAKQIAGDKIDVKLILQPGTSPHTFEITPALVRDLEEVETIFAIGHYLDNWVSALVGQNNKANLVTLDSGINLRAFGDEHGDKNDHEDEITLVGYEDDHEDEEERHSHKEGGFDPHYWLSPANAILIAQNIKQELVKIDSVNQEYYQNNLDDFIQKIEVKNIEWQEKIASLSTRDIVVFHDGWSYFADYFGLEIIASFEEFPGKEPSPAYLINVGKTIEDRGVKAMFIEPQLSVSSLKTLASDLGVSLGNMDPLGGVFGRDTYIDLIDYNINSLVANLK